MVWSLKESAGGLNHRFKGLQRVLFNVPNTRPFEELSRKTDKLSLVLDAANKPIPCKGCGYAIVRLAFADGWEVEACSVITAPKLIDNPKFQSWMESMPRQRVTSDVR